MRCLRHFFRKIKVPQVLVVMNPAPVDQTHLYPATITPDIASRKVGMDTRRAWTGHYPENVSAVVRVETGSFRGRPVYFNIVPEWRTPRLAVPTAPPLSETVGGMIVAGTLVLLFLGAVLLAWRNDRHGRGDRRGAFRLAVFMIVIDMLRLILRTNHVPSVDEIGLMSMSLAQALYLGVIIWLFYMAAEPYVRRLWPDNLIAWTRLLDGRFRDPLLGRHLLIGALGGIGFSFYFIGGTYVMGWLGVPPGARGFEALYFPSVSYAASNYLYVIIDAFSAPVGILLIILLLRVLLRRQWLAIAVFLALIFVVGFLLEPGYGLANGVFMAGWMAAFLAVLTRLGLFTALVCIVFSSWSSFAITLDPSSWYFGRTIVTLLVFAAIAIYGFAISVAGRPIFKDTVFD